jgi:hypothetical protein
VTAADSLRPVHLLALPVPLAAKSQQHFEELMREFALISTGARSADPDHHVPQRLMDLIDTLVQQFGGLNNAAEERLNQAIERGDSVIDDHMLEIPVEAGPASQMLGDMIDEADDYCRRGQHLLTLESPDDCVAYRRWYLGEVIGQLAGAAPVAWPDSEHAKGLAPQAS